MNREDSFLTSRIQRIAVSPCICASLTVCLKKANRSPLAPREKILSRLRPESSLRRKLPQNHSLWVTLSVLYEVLCRRWKDTVVRVRSFGLLCIRKVKTICLSCGKRLNGYG